LNNKVNKPGGVCSHVRVAAYKSLFAIDDKRRFSNIELDLQIKRTNFEGSDRALYTALVYGVLETKLRLDYLISYFTRRPASELDPDVRCVLRLAAYQSCFMTRIPAHAICSESVELCKRVCTRPKAKAGLVNAVSRKLTEKGREVPLPTRERNVINNLSIRYSISEDIARLWNTTYGTERTESILSVIGSSEFTSRLPLRVNSLRYTLSELIERLPTSIKSIAESKLSEWGLILHGSPVSELSCISDGSAFVQDEASQFCAELLLPKKGMKILDACAAPGGKSFSCAMLMNNEGHIDSCDLHANKLALINEGAARLGIDIIQTSARDSSVFVPDLENAYDRVLCDVPCSGLGVIGKKPEIRYKSLSDFDRLPDIQYRILSNCSRYLRRGGRLVYSTCTLNASENENNIRRFLDVHEEFMLVSERTLFPDTDGCDGFYTAAMIRK